MGEEVPLSQNNWEREFVLKEADLRLRQRQAGIWYSLLHSPVFLGLIAATFGLCGSVWATLQQSKSAERQAHVKAQADLVVEAIRTGDPKRAAKNLSFLVHLGLLDDPYGKMEAVLSQPDDVPWRIREDMVRAVSDREAMADISL